MRRHNLLLSLLALLFAVFMTACDNGTTNNAKAPIGDGGDQGGGAITPTLSISYKIDEKDYKKVYFTGRLDNANEEDYNFTWSFGDDVVSTESSLTIDHTYIIDRGYGVTLAATPKDPEKTPAIANATTTVTISQSGIHIQTLRYSALSGMEYEFQAIATTTDGSQVLYTWDFGDGTIIENTPQNAMTHRYTKYNTEYTVKVSVEKENAGNTGSVEFPEIKIKTHGVTAQLTIDDDINNKTFKRMSVNIYDETGALIHGYSDAEGEVTGLDNVTYTWNFGDNSGNTTTKERYVEHTYGTSTGNYPVTVTIISDSFTDTVSAEGTANVEVSYALTGLRAELGGQYGTELTVVAEGNGGETYANRDSIYYEITYPNGSKAGQNVSHNGSGVGTHTFTKDLDKYFNTYNIKVEAKANNRDGEVLATKTVTVEKPSFRYVLNGPNNGDNGYFSKSFNITVAQDSFELKGAYFDWNLGDGTTRRTQVPNTSHTYAGPGSKTVTVTINSDMLNGLDLTVPDLAKTFTINADVTINSLECPNAGAGSNFLQFNCRVDATGSKGTTLNYKWYKNGQAVAGCAGPYCEHTFDTYNRNNYSVKVEVSVQGSNSAPKSQTYTITTPNVQVTLAGPAKGIHDQNNIYTATTKVSHGGSSKDITLTGASYKFKIKENGGSDTISEKVWNRTFEPTPEDYGGNNSVNRTISVEVTASNLVGTITSNSVTTSISKAEATLDDFNQPVITCRTNNTVNQVKRLCKMTMQAKSTINIVQGDFNQYTAKFMFNNTSRTLTFKSRGISANATGETNEFEIDYNWPNNGDITTGGSQSQNYSVTGEVYKTGAANVKSPATPANFTISLSGDYVLFPLPQKLYTYNKGGSGYRFGTWSCGYNENYYNRSGDFNTVVNNVNCGSAGSGSGQTFNVPTFFTNDRRAKEALTLKWMMRLRKTDGTDVTRTIKTITLSKNQQLTDNDLRFDIISALEGQKFTGSAYNGTTNLFYLEISGNNGSLAKPVRIWYNGSNKTDRGNRLQKVTPLGSSNRFCKLAILQSGDGMGGYDRRIRMYVISAEQSFLGANGDTANKTSFVPTGDQYKPRFFFTGRVNLTGGGTSNEISGEVSRTSVQTGGTWAAHVAVIVYPADKPQVGNPDGIAIPNSITNRSGEMDIVIVDMLRGSNDAKIRNYYGKYGCSMTGSL